VGCGATITESVKLLGNLDCSAESPAPGTAVLTVAADNVTIDLGNYSIIDADDEYEILIRVDGRRNVTIKNGTVDGGADAGISIKDSNNVRVNRVSVFSVATSVADPYDTAGIYVSGSTRVHLQRVTVGFNGDDGIYITGSQRVEIDRANSSENYDDGLDVENSGKVEVHRSRFSRNTNGDGVEVDDTPGVHLHFVTADFNSGDGIDLDTTHGARIDHVSAKGNGDDGMEVDDTDGIRIRKSTFTNSLDDGLDIRNSSFDLHRVTVGGNSDDGLDVDTAKPFRIQYLTATTNGDDGVDIEGNSGATSDYIVQRTHSKLNGDNGFDLDFPVTGRRNSARGNAASNVAP